VEEDSHPCPFSSPSDPLLNINYIYFILFLTVHNGLHNVFPCHQYRRFHLHGHRSPERNGPIRSCEVLSRPSRIPHISRRKVRSYLRYNCRPTEHHLDDLSSLEATEGQFRRCVDAHILEPRYPRATVRGVSRRVRGASLGNPSCTVSRARGCYSLLGGTGISLLVMRGDNITGRCMCPMQGCLILPTAVLLGALLLACGPDDGDPPELGLRDDSGEARFRSCRARLQSTFPLLLLDDYNALIRGQHLPKVSRSACRWLLFVLLWVGVVVRASCVAPGSFVLSELLVFLPSSCF
jgi:hypothetical protein